MHACRMYKGLAIRLECGEKVKISEISRETYFPGNDYDTDITVTVATPKFTQN